MIFQTSMIMFPLNLQGCGACHARSKEPWSKIYQVLCISLSIFWSKHVEDLTFPYHPCSKYLHLVGFLWETYGMLCDFFTSPTQTAWLLSPRNSQTRREVCQCPSFPCPYSSELRGDFLGSPVVESSGDFFPPPMRNSRWVFCLQ